MNRGLYIIAGLCLLGGAPLRADTVAVNFSVNASVGDFQAQESVAQNLNSLSQSLDMVTGNYSDSHPTGANTNGNDNDPSKSTSTDHYNVKATCLEWLDSVTCKKVLDEGVAEHGLHQDSSPLERDITQLWQKMGQATQTVGNAINYSIYQIEAKGNGPILDRQKRLDWNNVAKASLQEPVKQAAEQVGYKTANRVMSLTYDEQAKKGDATKYMPSMESLRVMAQRFTTIFRNHLVTASAELTAGQKGIEAQQDEDIDNCDKYGQMVEAQSNPFKGQQRLSSQFVLDPETRKNSLAQRVSLCKQAKAASAYMVNATVKGNKIVAGSAATEQSNRRDYRVNLAMVDKVGLDANQVESNYEYTKQQQSQERGDWTPGGEQLNKVTETNAETLKGFNEEVDKAADGYSAVVARSGGALKDQTKSIRAQKIAIGSEPMERLNGPTREMEDYLKGTSFPRSSEKITADSNPATKMPESQSKLVVTKVNQ